MARCDTSFMIIMIMINFVALAEIVSADEAQTQDWKNTKQPISYQTVRLCSLSYVHLTGAASGAVTHHIMMTKTASLLRGNWFPKIRCKRHGGFSSSCNAVFPKKISYRRTVDMNCFDLSQNRLAIPAYYSKHDICISRRGLQAHPSPVITAVTSSQSTSV